MILVILGTQDSPFPRIVRRVEEACATLGLDEKIYAQVGTTKINSDRSIIKDYFDGETFQKLFEDARIIVCHGGAGTIFQGLHLQKKIIVLPRNADLGEHNDNHQFEITTKLADEGFIRFCEDDLTEAIRTIDEFHPKIYETKNDILETLSNYIESL